MANMYPGSPMEKLSYRESVLRRFRRSSPTDVPNLEAKIAQNNESNQVFEGLAAHILDTTPSGRNQATALTHLQTAKFFVNEARITGE